MKHLEEYNRKRDFSKTNEPIGAIEVDTAKTGKSVKNHEKRLRFAVQHHIASREHFDLRLEWDGVLVSFALPKGPSLNPSDKRLAVQVENHPLGYRDFEGIIPKGEYGGGTVMLWDEGFWTPSANPSKAFAEGRLKFELEGKRLGGKWFLTRLTDKGGKAVNWLLVKERDAFSRADAGISDYKTSVKSGLTMQQIGQGIKAKTKAAETGKEPKSKATERGAFKDNENPKIKAAELNSTGKTKAAEVGQAPKTNLPEVEPSHEIRVNPKAKTVDVEKTSNASPKNKTNTDKIKPPKTQATAKNKTTAKTQESCEKNPFSRADMQLAGLKTDLPTDGDWLYEMKYDGYRIMAFVEAGRVRLVSRGGRDYSEEFKDIADSLAALFDGQAAVLDGEVVVTDENGKTDFQALQSYFKNPERQPSYVVFDLLALGGKDLREESLLFRKQALKKVMGNAPENLHLSKFSEGFDKEMLKNICGGGFEGVIAKKADSPYSGTRNGDWIKLKCGKRQEFVIGGYTRTQKKARGISSLLLGYYEDGRLTFAGSVGTGITEKTAAGLEEKFAKIERKTSPFSDYFKEQKDRTTVWLKAEFAAEISFAEWTRDNLLRHPSFKGLRTDKPVREIVKESAKGGAGASPKAGKKESKARDIAISAFENTGEIKPERGKSEKIKKSEYIEPEESGKSVMKITSPDKLMFANPDITKLEVAEYYQKVAVRMFPFVEGRLLSLVNCPKGVGEPCFYKKHIAHGGGGIISVDISGVGKGAGVSSREINSGDRCKRGAVTDISGVGKGAGVSSTTGISGGKDDFDKSGNVNKQGGRNIWNGEKDSGERRGSGNVNKQGGRNIWNGEKGSGESRGSGKNSSEKSAADKSGQYFFISAPEGITEMVQMNTIEFHVWGSRAASLENPDMMVFDLDPDECLELAKVRRGVTDLHSVLKRLGLTAFLKTSGGKGYHVVVPFVPSSDWEAFSLFAKSIAEVMEQNWPDRYTSNMRKESRKGKIFIDWVRNTRGATGIAPYSLRARAGARVSMPISFAELGRVAPDGITMTSAIERLKRKDPWADFFTVGLSQKLK